MNSKALTLGVVSVVLGAGTYFVLNQLAPQRHAEEGRTSTGPTADQVFSGQVNLEAVDQAAAAAQEGSGEEPEVAALGSGATGLADDPEADLPMEEPEGAAPVGSAEEPEAPTLAANTGSATGAAEAPEASTLAQASEAEEPEPATLPPRTQQPTPLASPSTLPAVAQVEGATGGTPSSAAPAASQEAAPAANVAANQTPSTPPPPASTPAPASIAETAPAASATAAATPGSDSSTAPKPKAPARKLPKKVELAQAWWGPETPGALSVTYAGSASFRKALVLLFNGPFNSAESVNANVKVLDASGKAVSGRWEVNPKNPQMLLFPLSKSGQYRIVVNEGLQDSRNRRLARPLQGPVRVD